jgi:DsbC/DsbD-like thiol-disulfide interchange protein
MLFTSQNGQAARVIRRAVAVLVVFVAAAAGIAPSYAAISDWAQAEQATVRVFLSGEEDDGTLLGGVELRLEPNWYTYWRNPGEAGVPPVFDFSASENVAEVEVLYPTPERHDDGVSVSLIYRDAVVFPIAVVPRDAGQPVTLRLDLGFGVCSIVCVPTRAEPDALRWEASAPDNLARFLREGALGRVPLPPQPGRFAVEGVAWKGDALLIDVRMPETTHGDLFADVPTDWSAGQPVFVSRADGVSRYRLDVSARARAETGAAVTLRLVAVAGAEAIEQRVAVPARSESVP